MPPMDWDPERRRFFLLAMMALAAVAMSVDALILRSLSGL